MESKLYVGNLAYTATEDDLRALFAQAGTVKSVMVIKDRETGRSKGFAFVEMETEGDAQKAISMLNGTQFKDRALTVNVARPREESSRGGGFGNRRQDRPSGGRPRENGDRRRSW
jgi:RNA recognition motif-containing protein